MHINVTFRRLESSDELREYAEQRFSKLKKYADGPMDVNVVLSVEKFRQTAEVVISGDGIRAAAKEEQNEMRAAIDLVSDKIFKQLKKNREKMRSKRGAGPQLEPMPEESVSAFEGEDVFRVIHPEKIHAKPMSVEEAVAQLQVLDRDFMMFTNADTNVVNVVYWRQDGTLGLVEP
ncbi:MAG TPA: ribosome-associated translation inhibitor RaiA [Thermodesulfobacteriaceae bacterium]|nr:ribosome-associated translation inhibitor RaiA [Thermodesulfobacteriaceae bacterium]